MAASESEGSLPCLSTTACGTTHSSLRCRTYSTLFFVFQSGLPLHSTRPASISPLVDVLPPGLGSLDFSPDCFGTFHNDPLLACISSDALSFSTSSHVCNLAFLPCRVRSSSFLTAYRYGSRAALRCFGLFRCLWLFLLKPIYRTAGDVTC